VLETEWQHVASPERVQQLARPSWAWPTVLGAAELVRPLPRRGADPAPLNNTPLHNASAQIPRHARFRHVRI
jgi:hypothetical protein